MKELIVFFMIIFSVQFSIQAQGQRWQINSELQSKIPDVKGSSPFDIELFTGANIPLGEYGGNEQFAGTGLSFMGGVNYNWRLWGLGLTAGYFSNPISDKVKDRLDDLLLTYTNTYEKNRWTVSHYGIGPNINISSAKFPIRLYMRGGFMYYNTPQFSAVAQEGMIEKELLNYPSEESFSTAFISVGTQMTYQLNRNFGISLDVSYLSGLNPREYLYTFADFEIFGEPPYNEGEIIEAPISERVIEVNPQVFRVGVGVRYTFGAKKPKGPRGREKTEKELSARCLPVQLKLPEDQSDIYLNLEDRPDYTWQEHKATNARLVSHIFKLYDEKGSLLFQEQTKGNRIQHSRKLENIYEAQLQGKSEEERKTLQWQVVSQYMKCEQQKSKKRKISISKSSTGLTIDFNNIQCQNPAYDSAGNVHYTGDIEITNTGSSDITVLDPETNFTLENQNGNDVAPIDQITDPSGWSGDVSLSQGSSADFSIEFSRPVGETKTVIRVPYNVSGVSGVNNEPQLVDLPSCICNVCDDWRIIVKNSKMTPFATSTSNTEISSMINILNADPIIEVKAEIAYVERNVSSDQCSDCITNASQMGLATQGEALQIQATGTPSPWENQGNATLVEDENGDGYANQVRWRADDPETGIHLASAFRVYINLPEVPFEECCDQRYRVCVRYIFTDINCQTCEKIVCYGFSTNPESGGEEGTGSHTSENVQHK